MTQVNLYGRPGCHLCDEARDFLIEIRDSRRVSFDLIEIDIDGDDDLLRGFLERIPVIQVDGEIVSELIPDRAALVACLDNVET